MSKKSVFLISMILLCFSCKTTSKDVFVFKNGDKKIELKIPENHIVLDGETHINIILTNIDPSKLTIIGVGVSVIKKVESEMHIRVKTRYSFYPENAKYELRLSYMDNHKKVNHSFYIPLKKSEKENEKR